MPGGSAAKPAVASISTKPMNKSNTGITVWITGLLFGLIAAAIHVLVPEQALTLLWVMITTMALGVWKREAPWRWILLIVPFIPAADLVHKILRPQQVSRAVIWFAILIVLPAIAGAYGGSYMRLMIDNVFHKKRE
jgi:hypothetical protein